MPEEKEERVVVTAREVNWGLVAVGVGATVIGGYLFYERHSKNKLIRDYVSEVEEWEQKYREFTNNGETEPTPEQQEILDQLAKKIATKEYAIEERGLVGQLTDMLAKVFGIVVAWWAGKTIYAIIKKIVERIRPPPKCPVCGQIFNNPDEVNDHIRHRHHYDPSYNTRVVEKFRELPEFLRWTIEYTVGLSPEWVRRYESLSETERTIVAWMICIGVLLLIATGIYLLFAALYPALAELAALASAAIGA